MTRTKINAAAHSDAAGKMKNIYMPLSEMQLAVRYTTNVAASKNNQQHTQTAASKSKQQCTAASRIISSTQLLSKIISGSFWVIQDLEHDAKGKNPIYGPNNPI